MSEHLTVSGDFKNNSGEDKVCEGSHQGNLLSMHQEGLEGQNKAWLSRATIRPVTDLIRLSRNLSRSFGVWSLMSASKTVKALMHPFP
jgi:hypothetical protein